MDEEGTDVYPVPKSGMADRGRQHLRGERLCLLPQPAGSGGLRRLGHRAEMGRPPERPARLHLRTSGAARENADGSGSREHRKACSCRGRKRARARCTRRRCSSGVAELAAPPAASAAAPAGSPAAPAGSRCCFASAGDRRANRKPCSGTRQPIRAARVQARTSRRRTQPRGIIATFTLRAASPWIPSCRRTGFLYEKRRISGERAADALQLTGPDAPAEGWEIVPSYDAKCLVAYLMSLDQSHALKEVKSTAPASPPAPGKAVK